MKQSAAGIIDEALDMKRSANARSMVDRHSRPDASLESALNFTLPALTNKQTRHECEAGAQQQASGKQRVGETAES
jgi:hypothetical protein